MPTSVDNLIKLIEQLDETVKSLVMDNGQAVKRRPLWETMDPIAQKLGLLSYQELSGNFNLLIQQSHEDLLRSPNMRESTKLRYIKKLNDVDAVFDAINFTQQTENVFKTHFSEVNIDALHMLSERIEREGKPTTSLDDLRISINELDAAIIEFSNAKGVNEAIKSALRAHLKSLKDSIENYDIFGEGAFWDRYSIILAQMTAAYPDLNEEEKEKMRPHTGGLYSRLRENIGIASDSFTIAAPFIDALPKA